ncbi:hypothetical protein BDB00DRAFT_855244 [Zychaea mexicana]|uniref:uncharacterized protein n=1 Tax=Zychaea mexicana TaxID=64656 RepID=UPI0022FE2511|nr:uncharacterized protein BDB00DRAFT_855244 [Zychaea mexicana]KAI9484502.1 hypothetical protein BDB00DRAFT_855244 [Zychaea mexicana]
MTELIRTAFANAPILLVPCIVAVYLLAECLKLAFCYPWYACFALVIGVLLLVV